MTERTDTSNVGRTDDERADAGEPVEAIGTYETDEGVVLYDTENPLAWIQSPSAVRPEEMV